LVEDRSEIVRLRRDRFKPMDGALYKAFMVWVCFFFYKLNTSRHAHNLNKWDAFQTQTWACILAKLYSKPS
jgi:hypothetical protein